MKKLLLILSTSFLIFSSSTFAKVHYYQKLCNYTQKSLFITTSDEKDIHTKKLNGATIPPNQCPTFRYVVSSNIMGDDTSFVENIYKTSPPTPIAKLAITHTMHKRTYVDFEPPINGFLVGLSHHHRRHYTIYVCDPANANYCK